MSENIDSEYQDHEGSPPPEDDDVARVMRHVRELGEHFTNVQIMVSYNDCGNTHGIYRGCGDWYARQGLAHEFIDTNVSDLRARSIHVNSDK